MHILLTRFHEAHLASSAAQGEQFSTRTVLKKTSNETLAKESHCFPSSASEEIHRGYTQTQTPTHTYSFLSVWREKNISWTQTHKRRRTCTHRGSQRSDEIDERRIHGEPGGLDKYWPEWMRSVTVHKRVIHSHTVSHHTHTHTHTHADCI